MSLGLVAVCCTVHHNVPSTESLTVSLCCCCRWFCVLQVNMCPWYAPVHVHQGKARNDGRLRINHYKNAEKRGLSVDLSSLCKQSDSSR
jgi:hypothetical protein